MNFFKSKIFTLIVIIFLSFALTPTASAHAADVFSFTYHMLFSVDGVEIETNIFPGPLISDFVWSEADQDMNESISEEEADAWAELRLNPIVASINGEEIDLKIDSISWPEDIEQMMLGEQTIQVQFTADWPSPVEAGSRFYFENTIPNSLHMFTLESNSDNLPFKIREQSGGVLNIAFTATDDEAALTFWDSGKPAIPGTVSSLGFAQEAAANSQQTGVIGILDGMIRNNETSPVFYLSAFSLSLVLGALHALSPGHGKTVVAAYLVGASGKTYHALALGSIVTLTHTGSVFAIGLITLAASSYFLPTDIFPYLEIISGILILVLGFTLLLPRLRSWAEKRQLDRRSQILERSEKLTDNPGGERLVLNQPIVEVGPAHSHLPEEGGVIPRGPIIGNPLQGITWRSLITLGISGGLVPCPDAIAILLIAVTINRIAFGLSLILSFSLGLAVVLIVIGLLIVQGRRLFERLRWFDRVAFVMPVVSALIVFALGAVLTVGAVKRLPQQTAAAVQQPLTIDLSAATEWDQMAVIYVNNDDRSNYQLFQLGLDEGSQPIQLTDTLNGVAAFSVAPDQTTVYYAASNQSLGTAIWKLDLTTKTHTMLTDCKLDYCDAPVSAPIGDQLIYERLPDPSDANSLGITTLWWLDGESGETGPVFQDAELQGLEPSFSADGQWLSYVSAIPRMARFYNFNTGATYEIPLGSGTGIRWHPVKELVLYTHYVDLEDNTLNKLFIFDPNSEESTQLLSEPYLDETGSIWSPDGSQIATIRTDWRNPDQIGNQIWLVDDAGGDAHPITEQPDILHRKLSFSPDGKALLYQVSDLNDVENPFQVRVLIIETGEILSITSAGLEPAWIYPSSGD